MANEALRSVPGNRAFDCRRWHMKRYAARAGRAQRCADPLFSLQYGTNFSTNGPYSGTKIAKRRKILVARIRIYTRKSRTTHATEKVLLPRIVIVCTGWYVRRNRKFGTIPQFHFPCVAVRDNTGNRAKFYMRKSSTTHATEKIVLAPRAVATYVRTGCGTYWYGGGPS